jgi:hypothetical protein
VLEQVTTFVKGNSIATEFPEAVQALPHCWRRVDHSIEFI